MKTTLRDIVSYILLSVAMCLSLAGIIIAIYCKAADRPAYPKPNAMHEVTTPYDHVIIIGGCGITASQSYELAFGGCYNQTIYRVKMTPAEYDTIIELVTRAKPELIRNR